ncbi:MAG: tryptophan--tRNA ligase [Candidatus Aenigmatarchaeota archaeon]
MPEEDFEVTPWDVEGNVDYQRLIDKFGTEKIGEGLRKDMKEQTEEEHLYLRRDYFFSHRDLDKVLEDYREGDGFFLYTGVGPSGPMHIGHIIPFYFSKWLQQKFDVNLYIQVTDDERFLTDDGTIEEVDEYAEENIMDIAAVGLDPDKTFIFRDREYMGNMYEGAVRVAKKVNFSVARSVFGFGSSTNIGMVFFPAVQMMPTFFEKKRCLIPAAIDQDPYWRIQRDIAEKLGYYKAAQIHSKFIPALKGPEGKMSSSKPKDAIMLDDSPGEVEKKVKEKAYSGGQVTKDEQREKGADLSVDVSYQWLHNLLMEDDDRLEKIAKKYSSGEMLTGEIKQILVEELNKFLGEHQRRKEEQGEEMKERMMYEGKLAKEMWDKKIDLD